MSEFARQGFILKAGTIPNALLAAAAAELPKQVNGPFHDQLFDEEQLQRQYPSVLQLRQFAIEAATEILGAAPDPLQNQLAIRPAGAESWDEFHIDGNRIIDDYGDDWNQMPLFQVIAGIPLVSTNSVDRGNLVVMPGGHREVAEYIRNSWSNLAAYPSAHQAFKDVFRFCNELHLPEQPLFTELGDFYICDALMPHRALANFGELRAVWYFRLGIPTARGYQAFV